jgi:diguanylate cyclase (GGDEF)-like protein
VKATGATAAVLWRPVPEGNDLIATAVAGGGREGARLPFVTPGSGAIRAFTGAEARFGEMSGHTAMQELAPEFTAGAALWQPVLRNEGAAVGVLALYWTEAPEALSGEKRQAARLLALEAAIAIERGELLGRLEEAARTDDLTGLLNRRAWNSELGRELARASRNGTPLCMAILDLDRFKEYNDTHGHLAGDRFLKRMAAAWSESVRNTDILARYGGEEFAVAMPGLTVQDAGATLERLRDALSEGQTCSAGVCVWDGEESAEALIARADTALYEAKASGRDRIVGG